MCKKIHSVLTLLLCSFLFVHCLMGGLVMLHIYPSYALFNFFGYGALFLFALHLIFVIILVITSGKRGRGKPYVRLNLSCYIQRISGVLILICLHPHFSVLEGKMPMLIATLVLVLACGVHISVSIPKALFGLGMIVDEQKQRRAERISMISGLTLTVFTICCLLYLGMGF